MCTLRELYGPGVEKVGYCVCERRTRIDVQLRIDQRVFVTPSNRKLDVNVVQSNYHIELTPSYVLISDLSPELTGTGMWECTIE